MYTIKTRQNNELYLVLCILGGYLGLHYFYRKQVGKGLLYLFTGGLLGIGWFIDIILAITKLAKSTETTLISTSSNNVNTITTNINTKQVSETKDINNFSNINRNAKYYDVIFSSDKIDSIIKNKEKYKLIDDEYFRAYTNYNKTQDKTIISVKSKNDKYIEIGFIKGNLYNDINGNSDIEKSLSTDLSKLNLIYTVGDTTTNKNYYKAKKVKVVDEHNNVKHISQFNKKVDDNYALLSNTEYDIEKKIYHTYYDCYEDWPNKKEFNFTKWKIEDLKKLENYAECARCIERSFREQHPNIRTTGYDFEYYFDNME